MIYPTAARMTPRGKNYLVTIVGKLLGLQVGESLEVEGRWVDHPEHGRQFEVERYRSVLPATVEGIRRYLGSGLIKGVGPVTAKRIAETFGAYTLEVIDNQPLRLREVPGLGPKRVERIIRAWEEQALLDILLANNLLKAIPRDARRPSESGACPSARRSAVGWHPALPWRAPPRRGSCGCRPAPRPSERRYPEHAAREPLGRAAGRG